MRFFINRFLNIVSRAFPVFNLRIPEELKERIEASAQQNKRSQNAEYLHRLEHSFVQDDQLAQILEELKLLRQEVAELKSDKDSTV